MLESSIDYLLTLLWTNIMEIKKINNEIKSYINQATFISLKCRNKLIKLLCEEFEIDIPLENYANIDVQITNEGNIVMRGDLYESPNKYTSKEVEERYNNFKEKAEHLINKKEVNYHNKKDINNVLNIIIVIFLSLIYIIVVILFIRSLISLQLFTASILAALLSSYLAPGIKSRFEQAKNFIKRKLKK